jgi:CRP-like cAMP-binding protein
MTSRSTLFSRLRPLGQEMIVPAAAIILDVGERPDGAYLITAGKVRSALTSPEGTEVWSRIDEEGAILGLPFAVGDQRLRIRVTAVEPTHVVFVERDLVAKLVKHDPECRAELLASLSQEVTVMLRTWTALAERVPE